MQCVYLIRDAAIYVWDSTRYKKFVSLDSNIMLLPDSNVPVLSLLCGEIERNLFYHRVFKVYFDISLDLKIIFVANLLNCYINMINVLEHIIM